MQPDASKEASQPVAWKRDEKGLFVPGNPAGPQTPFQKGVALNPGGRISAKDFRTWMKKSAKDTDPERIERFMMAGYLTAIDRTHPDHATMWELIAGYMWGSVPKGVEISGPAGGPVEVNATAPSPVASFLEEAIRRAREGRPIIDIPAPSPPAGEYDADLAQSLSAATEE